MPGTWERDRNERNKREAEFERAFGKRTSRKAEKTSREAMRQIAEWEQEHQEEIERPAKPKVEAEKTGCWSTSALILLSLALLVRVIA